MPTTPRRLAAALFAFVGLAAGPAAAGTVTSAPPSHPDPAAHYLFYMHGREVETGALNPQAGVYDYDGILAAFARRGFVVIGEHRGPDTRVGRYARKVADQVHALIAAGVPARNITVAGHSKGGAIALNVASRLRQRQLNYVILAGCIASGNGPLGGGGLARFVATRASKLRGRILSVYDSADTMAGSCRTAFAAAPDAVTRETVLHTGRGHWLFYQPGPVWMDLVQGWAGRQ